MNETSRNIAADARTRDRALAGSDPSQFADSSLLNTSASAAATEQLEAPTRPVEHLRLGDTVGRPFATW